MPKEESMHYCPPRGACHNHLKTHPSILKAGRIARDNPTEIPLVEDNYPPPNPEAPYRENYTSAARKHDDKGPTFMDNFWSDPKADERKSNIFFPFASSEEWEFASWLLKANLPLAITDEFLKLRLAAKMHLSFKNAKDFRDRIESLPPCPQWKVKLWDTRPHPTKKPLTLFYRDPLECLQALLSNPLVQDHIQFTPFKLWETSAKLMRLYTEWLSGDAAWDLQASLTSSAEIIDLISSQSKYPEGTTLLPTTLATDKTTLTSMTGDRQAYPCLISLANILMEFRMKACHHAFLLLALLPIAKFLEKDSEIRGVLVAQLFHAIMDFVLKPLKKTAEIAQLMTDPLGWRRFCVTPLAAYIVDTPESTLIAGVAGKQSAVTMASYHDLGDPFRHESRTANHTLSKLIKLEEPPNSPHDLHRYVKKAKAEGLSGVHRLFWCDWRFADPSDFLTPEILHHWLKMFFDHVCKWCIEAAGAEEVDFRFSILRPHTGMRHFKEGISKAKQMTGREHRDIQRYLIPVIAGAAGISKKFLTAITALNDFFYHGQAPKIKEDTLNKLDDLLQKFHDNKKAILDAGARKGKNGPIDNWYIPKLEILHSVVPQIRKNGAPLQWSADVTERAHIDLVKDPAENSNNQKHEEQICRHLDRQEKARGFDLATAIASAGVDFRHRDPAEAEGDEENILPDEPSLLLNSSSGLLARIEPASRLSGSSWEQVNYFLQSSLLAKGRFPNAPIPFRTFTSFENNTAFHLNRDPVGPQITVDAAATRFRLPDLRCTLAGYLSRPHDGRLVIGGRRPTLQDYQLPFEKIQFWDKVRIQNKSFHDSSKILVAETVNAAPPDSKWKCGRADAVLVNTDLERKWPHSGLKASRNQRVSGLRSTVRYRESRSSQPDVSCQESKKRRRYYPGGYHSTGQTSDAS
ncbi:hypothetical protein K438DRAFT_1788654 [Mycena galopus ATCC 62051]|nr:hypothetical protein K438DRAFT_1788654 [Mycena galopus ATCC 62051]